MKSDNTFLFEEALLNRAEISLAVAHAIKSVISQGTDIKSDTGIFEASRLTTEILLNDDARKKLHTVIGGALLKRYHREREKKIAAKKLSMLPVCTCCGERIKEDHVYRFGNRYICENCMDDFVEDVPKTGRIFCDSCGKSIKRKDVYYYKTEERNYCKRCGNRKFKNFGEEDI